MKKRIQKKSEVLREGYIKGLRRAKSIIAEQLAKQTKTSGTGAFKATVNSCYNDGWDAETSSRCEVVDDFPKFDGSVLYFDDTEGLLSELSELIGIPSGGIDVYPVNDGFCGQLYATFLGDDEGKYTQHPDNIFDLAMSVEVDGKELDYEDLRAIFGA